LILSATAHTAQHAFPAPMQEFWHEPVRSIRDAVQLYRLQCNCVLLAEDAHQPLGTPCNAIVSAVLPGGMATSTSGLKRRARSMDALRCQAPASSCKMMPRATAGRRRWEGSHICASPRTITRGA
jgi:hypothetical protein